MFTLQEIAAVTGGKLIDPSQRRVILKPEGLKDLRSFAPLRMTTVTGISTDSRSIKAGDLFVPLKGDRFDAHAFIKDVFSKGARASLTDRFIGMDYPIIQVADTLKALQQLALHYRKRFSIPIIAVTGSAGKTTTKEYMGLALSRELKVKVGLGNLNNHIGVPLNLFRLDGQDQCAVFELGANHPGEIKMLSEIAQPTVGVITGIYPVHLEGFGSLERIYDAKLELANYLEGKGTVIANGDDSVLTGRLKNRWFQFITFGTSGDCDYRISNLHVVDNQIQFDINEQYHFKLKGHGAFNAQNALAAIATAAHLKVDLELLSKSWTELPQIQNRFSVHHWPSHDLLIVDDSYNANPKSFERAVESFKEIAKERRKIIVIGDMLELGERSGAYHKSLGRFLASQNVDVLIAVGSLSRLALDEFSKIDSRASTAHFEKMESACSYLNSNLREGDGVLIKGSHGTRLYKIKPYLEERFNVSSASV